ncbi:Mcm10-like protein [Globisporangium polare]
MWNWNALSQQATQQNAQAAPASPQQQQQAPQLLNSSTNRPPPPARVQPPPARAQPRPQAPRATPRGAPLTGSSHVDKQPAASSVTTAAAVAISANANSKDKEDVEKFSGLRITRRTISAQDVHAELSERMFIPLKRVDAVPKDTFTSETIDWVTIGVLARKTMSKASANGGSFMVWSLSDLSGTELGVFLFGEAYETHWKEMEGSVVAVLNAALLPATEKNRFAFKVSQANEVVKLGSAVDFGICKGLTSGEARCRLAVNTAKSQYCLHHIQAKFLQAGKGRQQLNNSMGNFRKNVFSSGSQPKNISAGVYTSAAPMRSAVAAGASGWHVPSSTGGGGAQKRKRNSSEGVGFHGGPMRLSVSGAVIQNAPRPAAPVQAKPALLQSGKDDPLQKPSSRSQRIISSIISTKPGEAPAPLKKLKTKKVNMMQFMNTGTR